MYGISVIAAHPPYCERRFVGELLNSTVRGGLGTQQDVCGGTAAIDMYSFKRSKTKLRYCLS